MYCKKSLKIQSRSFWFGKETYTRLNNIAYYYFFFFFLCLSQPLEPTWSVKSLLNTKNSNNTMTASNSSPISDEQLDHLFQLAQLRPPTNAEDRRQLTIDMDDLTKFIQSIQQKDFGDTAPMTHVWQDDTGMTLRSDDVSSNQSDQVKGTALLDNAKQTFPPFFAVKGQHQEN
jgi:Asp-tRNA(Asn)/Glu-tRNA(Gln) amidotransferase C subunit